jgi:hydroxyacylglutathione hydrolase
MEGLDSWRSKGAKVDRDEKLVQFLKETEGERKASAPVPLPPEPEPLPGMDAKALKKLLDAGVDILCVFAGDRKTYEDGHVPGAHHVPVAAMEKWFADVDKNQLIVVMCGCCMGRNGGMSEAGFKKLEELGFTRVMHLDGHMNGWKVAGLPVQTEDPPPRRKK